MSKYAVLIPWVAIGSASTETQSALLLEVRSQKVRQPGEVCFPGGRMEQGETAAETAIRETCEELGVRADDIEIIKEMDPFVMSDGRTVSPVHAMLHITEIEKLRLSEDEVSEIFLLPVAWLSENEPVHFDLAHTEDDDLPEKLRGYLSHYSAYRRNGETDYYEYEGHGIWGLTARIIKAIVSAEQ